MPTLSVMTARKSTTAPAVRSGASCFLFLQDLFGKQLTAIRRKPLSKFLPDDVLREVQEFQRIKTFKAKQRQIQHIGKLL